MFPMAGQAQQLRYNHLRTSTVTGLPHRLAYHRRTRQQIGAIHRPSPEAISTGTFD